MLNLLFSPSGRIGSSEFMKAAIILVVVAFVLSLPEVFGMSTALTAIAGILGLITYYCWVAIWIKRYHDAGKPGANCLIPIAVYLVVIMIVIGIMVWPYVSTMFEAGQSGEGYEEIGLRMNKEKGLMINVAAAAVSLGVAWLFNNLIKHEPNDNRFGPA